MPSSSRNPSSLIPNPHIRENLRECRHNRHLTQDQLARRCVPALRQHEVSNIERGLPATRDELERLAVALGVSVKRLLRPRPRLKPLPDEPRVA
jgi:transcriptional regulator with XRE-family HTH domain